MFIYANNQMVKTHDIIIQDVNFKQIIFATLENKSLYNWLKNELQLPSQIFEDIQEDDQSVSYEEYENIKLTVAKYLTSDKDEYLFYKEFNISIMNIKNILLIICYNKEILTLLSEKFLRRYKKQVSIEYATYTVLDILIDNLITHTDAIDTVLEKLEHDILEEDILAKKLQRDVYFTRRTLHKITKLSAQEAVSISKYYNALSQKEKKSLKYEFIDIKEHLQFLIGESRELLDRTGYLLNLHMGMMSNKMNQAMQKLAAISLIFLPLTFIVGNYGMNFQDMPEFTIKHGYILVTLLNISIASGIYLWLKKKKWI